MFGLDDAVEAQIIYKVLLPLLIQFLQKSGAIGEAEKISAMGVVEFVAFAKTIKTYSTPDDFPHKDKPAVMTNLTNNGNPVT